MHVLGLDAGGTKTVCVLADGDGATIDEGRAPGANLQGQDSAGVEQALAAAIAAALGGRRVVPDAVCAGIAGVDREEDVRAAAAILQRLTASPRILIVNDALVALVSGVGDGPGIVIIAGTGSIVYGRNAANQAARAGGWGHIIGDEGSGYWIGREALAAVVRDVDGRGPATELTRAVSGHFGLADISGLVRIVYDRELPRASVAAIGPIVQDAAAAGDAVATRILERAAAELVAAAQAVASRLEMRGDSFRFVLAGGVFGVVPWLASELTRRLVEVAPRSDVRRLEVEPAAGAVHLALAHARGGAHLPTYAHPNLPDSPRRGARTGR
ncbi:MAG: N-acetylglucosamine kinase [Betaproteobacteria bacterium]